MPFEPTCRRGVPALPWIVQNSWADHGSRDERAPWPAVIGVPIIPVCAADDSADSVPPRHLERYGCNSVASENRWRKGRTEIGHGHPAPLGGKLALCSIFLFTQPNCVRNWRRGCGHSPVRGGYRSRAASTWRARIPACCRTWTRPDATPCRSEVFRAGRRSRNGCHRSAARSGRLPVCHRACRGSGSRWKVRCSRHHSRIGIASEVRHGGVNGEDTCPDSDCR